MKVSNADQALFGNLFLKISGDFAICRLSSKIN